MQESETTPANKGGYPLWSMPICSEYDGMFVVWRDGNHEIAAFENQDSAELLCAILKAGAPLTETTSGTEAKLSLMSMECDRLRDALTIIHGGMICMKECEEFGAIGEYIHVAAKALTND